MARAAHISLLLAIAAACASSTLAQAAQPTKSPGSPEQPEVDQPAAEPPLPARIRPEAPQPAPAPQNQWEQFKQDLHEKYGTTIGLNLDAVGRAAVAGPDTDIERMIARYDALIRQEFTDDSLIDMVVRGGWGRGLDPYLGLFSNTDQYANTGEQIFVLHLYYQHQLLDDQLTLRFGKFDIGDWIDTNRYGYYNFLGYSFAHNATIPLTGNTMSAMATWAPKDRPFYISGGFSNSTQTPFETGFSSTFDGTAEWLSIAEVGFKPKIAGREGIYRLTGWHNSKDFSNSAGELESGAAGGALSFDQDLTEQLGSFFRVGAIDGDPLEPKRYYSGGIYVKEPIPGRKDDSLALGVVVNEFGDARAGSAGATDTETYWELYYNYIITSWAQIQPVLQVVDNPGGTDRDTALIFGAHLALRF